jgi:hypothetical protein
MIDKIKNRFKQRCYDFVLCHYRKIPQDKFINAEFSLSNSACQNNAVASVRAGRADKVLMVWGGTSNGCIHFINKKDGFYFDETWHDYDSQDYFIIREVVESEYSGICDLLEAPKRMLFNMNGTMLSRYFGMKNINRWI